MKRFLRISDVEEMTGLSVPTIYRYVKERGFPKGIKLSPGAVRWPEAEVVEWMESQPRAELTGETY